jgi:3-oxoacyl-[acyl-carrier-protein] synthase III
VTLHLHGLGHFHPENEITNKLLEELEIGTNNEWIVERVGIRSRRTVLPLDYIRTTKNLDVRAAAEAALYTNTQLGARAAELALARAGIDRARVGLVLSGSSAPGVTCPAEAAFVAKELGIEVAAFDLNSACTTFLAQLFHLSLMQPERVPDFVLIVQTETLTTATNYTDRSTSVLFGDGAAAAVVSLRVPGRARVLHVNAQSSPAGAEKVVIPRTGYFRQDGRAVQMFAIKRTREGYERIVEARRDDPEAGARPLHFVGHQANLRVLEQVCERCAIAPERHHANVELHGNTGGASAPSVLSMEWEKWQPHDDVAVSVVGGGLTWARALVRFGGGA